MPAANLYSTIGLNLKYSSRLLLGSSELTYSLFKYAPQREGFISNSDKMVSMQTDLCIDGFPHSGNTFFTRLAQHWNPGCQIARHMHVPYQIKAAAAKQIPTLVLIREPADAIGSLLFKYDQLSPTIAVFYYYWFYRSLMQYRDSFIVVRFKDMVADPVSYFKTANQQFNARIVYHHYNEQVERSIIKKIPRKVQKTHTAKVIGDRKKIISRLEKMHLFHCAKRVHSDFTKQVRRQS